MYWKSFGQEERSGISRLWKKDVLTRDAIVSCHFVAPIEKDAGVAVSSGSTRIRNDKTVKGPHAESITIRATADRVRRPGYRSSTSIKASSRPAAANRNARLDATERLDHRPARNKPA